MKVINIRIEASSGFFWAYGLNVNKVYVGGATEYCRLRAFLPLLYA